MPEETPRVWTWHDPSYDEDMTIRIVGGTIVWLSVMDDGGRPNRNEIQQRVADFLRFGPPVGESWIDLDPHRAVFAEIAACLGVVTPGWLVPLAPDVLALLIAAKAGNAEKVAALLATGVSPDASDQLGRSALWYAAYHGREAGAHEAAALLLIRAGADVRRVYSFPDRDVVLLDAVLAAYRSPRMLASLALEAIARGADPNRPDHRGLTPLMRVTKPDSRRVVEALLTAGADIDARDAIGKTALHHAVHHGNQETAAALLDHGADVHTKTTQGVTPLMVACGFERGDIWRGGPLPYIARRLLDRGSDPNARDLGGETALDWATRSNSKACVELLRGRIAEPTASGAPASKTVLVPRELLSGPVYYATAPAFSPNGREMVIGDRHGNLLFWEVGSWRPLRWAKVGSTHSVLWSACGRWIVVSEGARGVGVSSLVVMCSKSLLPIGRVERMGTIALGGNGAWVASGDSDVLVMQIADLKPRFTHNRNTLANEAPWQYFDVARLSADPWGTFLVTLDDGGYSESGVGTRTGQGTSVVQVLDVEKQLVVGELAVGEHLWDIAFDAGSVLTAGFDGTIARWTLGGTMLRRWHAHEGGVGSLATTRVGLVASIPSSIGAGARATPGAAAIRAWREHSDGPIAEHVLPAGPLPDFVGASPDGRWLFTPERQGSQLAIRVWEVSA